MDDGRTLRDKGINLVLANNDAWKKRVRALVPRALALLPHRFIAEQLNDALRRCGSGEPRHPNGWGGIASGLVGQGVLVEVMGLRAQMQHPESHARRSTVYEVNPLS